MEKTVKVITMIMVLIGIYLFVSKGNETVRIIQTIAQNSISGIKTLQGR